MKVFAASVRAIVADVVGNVMVVASVPAKVSVLLTLRDFPEAITSPRYCEVQFAAVVGVATTA